MPRESAHSKGAARNAAKFTATSPTRCSRGEEIIRTSPLPRRSPRSSMGGRFRETQIRQRSPPGSPQVGTWTTEQGITYPSSPRTRITNRPASTVRRFKSCDMGKEAAKTIGAVDEALRAVRSALKADGSDCRRRLSKNSLDKSCFSTATTISEDTESDFGAESIASTACTSTPSEDGARRMASSLEDSRRLMKERVQAQERSVSFTRGLLNKLSAISDALDETDHPS